MDGLTDASSGRASPALRERGRIGVRVAAVLLGVFAINALAQAVRWSLGWDSNPTFLGLEQWASGTVALVAAIGAWRRARWAAAATVLYALLLGTLLGTLGPVLDLDPDARDGLVGIAIIAVAIVVGIAVYLWKALAPEPPPG